MNVDTSTRRKIDELRTLYTIYPDFREVIVEGRDDVAWLRWYLREHNADHVKVFAVDDRVVVPSDLPTRIGEDVNARGRVVALSAEYDKWNLPQNSLTCVADADYDILEDHHRSSSLLKTDYAAMEVYALAERPLSKFLLTSAKKDIAAQDLISVLKPAWTILYSVRYVLHRHSDGMKLAEKFAAKCVDNSGKIVANARVLLQSAQPSPTQEVLSELLEHHQRYFEQLPKDPLQGIRGHDVAPILARFLGLKNDLARSENLETILRQAIELRDLDDFDLFKSLRKRVI